MEPPGLEPGILGLKGRCLNHLARAPKLRNHPLKDSHRKLTHTRQQTCTQTCSTQRTNQTSSASFLTPTVNQLTLHTLRKLLHLQLLRNLHQPAEQTHTPVLTDAHAQQTRVNPRNYSVCQFHENLQKLQKDLTLALLRARTFLKSYRYISF